MVAHKAAGPGTAHDSAPIRAGVSDSLRAERQAAKLQAEQGLAALQATLQQLEDTRQLEAVALQSNLPLRAAALQASHRQLQQQVAPQRLRHQEARYAELCARHRLALAEGTKDSHLALAGEQPYFTPPGHYSKQPPRFGAAARKVWQELPQGIAGHPYIAHRVRMLTQGPSNRSKTAGQNGILPKSRFWPGTAAAVRTHPAGNVAPSCPISAGGAQAPVPATHRLSAQPRTISEQPSRVSTAKVQQQPALAANSILQIKDRSCAEVSPRCALLLLLPLTPLDVAHRPPEDVQQLHWPPAAALTRHLRRIAPLPRHVTISVDLGPAVMLLAAQPTCLPFGNLPAISNITSRA